MDRSWCSPCLRGKQSSCRRPFKVWLLPQLEESSGGGSYWLWKRTAARPNSHPAAGIPSAKSPRLGQAPELAGSVPLNLACVSLEHSGAFRGQRESRGDTSPDRSSRRHPCASRSLHLHQVVKRTFTSKLSNMLGAQMETGVPVDQGARF